MLHTKNWSIAYLPMRMSEDWGIAHSAPWPAIVRGLYQTPLSRAWYKSPRIAPVMCNAHGKKLLEQSAAVNPSFLSTEPASSVNPDVSKLRSHRSTKVI